MPNLLIPSHSLNSSILHKIQQKSDYQGIILEDSGQDALDSNLSLENEIIIGCLTDPNSKRLLAELNVFAQKNPDASILFIPKLRLSRAGVACELPAETLQKLFSLSTLIHDVTPIAIAVEHQSYLAPIAKPKAKTATLGASFSIQEKSQEQQLNLFWESLLSAQEQAFSQQSVLNENLSHSLLYRLKYFGKTKYDGSTGLVVRWIFRGIGPNTISATKFKHFFFPIICIYFFNNTFIVFVFGKDPRVSQ